jgi:hypothetical protein
MAEQSLLSTLLSPTLAAQMASREEEARIAEAGSPLLREAARTAGMFTRQLGGLTGTDVRSPEVQKISQMQSIIQGAEGADIYEKMENALQDIEAIDPAMAINLGKVVTERKAQARGLESRNALATYFAQQGYPVLAEAVATGQMSPAEALKELRGRRELDIKEAAETRKAKPDAYVKAKDIPSEYYGAALQSMPTAQSLVKEITNQDRSWWERNAPDWLTGLDEDAQEASIMLRVFGRAEALHKESDGKISRDDAIMQALSELKQGETVSPDEDEFAGIK